MMQLAGSFSRDRLEWMLRQTFISMKPSRCTWFLCLRISQVVVLCRMDILGTEVGLTREVVSLYRWSLELVLLLITIVRCSVLIVYGHFLGHKAWHGLCIQVVARNISLYHCQ